MADAKFFEGYARYNDFEKKYETWDDSVKRVMDMHRMFYKDRMSNKLEYYINYAEELYKQKKVLGAQRALQFGGDQLLKHHARLYNCTSSYADRAAFFGEAFYLMLCGAGVGFSVQKKHVKTVPKIQRRVKMAKTLRVPDSIEGWAQAVDVLLSSFFVGGGVYPDYEARKIYFDLEDIRPKGSKISGGFKAPGPEPLRKSLDFIEQLIKDRLREGNEILRPIDVYDIVMHCADAVISGGVRRAATICLFSRDDDEMMKAKIGNWFIENPQRGRSNNSVVLIRNNTSESEFHKIMKMVKEFGEPGFILVDDEDYIVNPCAEIGMYPKTKEGKSGWQACNLSEINGGKSNSTEEFLDQCKAASILGTLQAGYTDFNFLGPESKEIIDREALIGVGITGWMNNPNILFNEKNLKQGVKVVKKINKEVAELIGINQAARTTTVKPSGNASVLLETSSGIHGDHAPKYIRNVQFNKETEIAKIFKEKNPCMVEESIWSNNGTDYVVSFPIESPKNSIFKSELLGIKQLEYVKMAQEYWVTEGKNNELCVKPWLNHNVSNTIIVDDWEEVTKYVYNNRYSFCGVSFLSASGDKAFNQAPFLEVLDMKQITKKYGDEALLTSALIEAGLIAFNDNLWMACDTAMGRGLNLNDETHSNVLKRDFVRRFKKFATNFESEEICTECLKDVYLFHKWWKITKSAKHISFVDELKEKTYTDIDTMGAQACNGGSCEIW